MINTKMALRLGLGILCGLALVLLPAVFSTTTPAASNPTLTNRYGPAATNYAQPSLGSLGLNSAGMNGLSFLTIILFIFLPSTIFSLLIRRWAEKRAREYL